MTLVLDPISYMMVGLMKDHRHHNTGQSIQSLDINPRSNWASSLSDHSLHVNGAQLEPANPAWFTKKEIAKILKVSDRTISNWMDSGKLEYFKPDGTVRISREMLQRFVDRYSSKPSKGLREW